MKKVVLLTLLLIITLKSFTQNWQQVDDKTSVNFKIKNFGLNVDGTFKGVDIAINFDKENIPSFSLEATIKVKSIDTGIESRDEHLFKEDYFNKEKHPNIHLTSSKIEKIKNNDYLIFAKLTIKNTTKSYKIPIKIEQTQDKISLASEFSLKRKDFDVGGSSLVLGNVVTVNVKFTGKK